VAPVRFAQINERYGFILIAREPDPDISGQKLLGQQYYQAVCVPPPDYWRSADDLRAPKWLTSQADSLLMLAAATVGNTA